MHYQHRFVIFCLKTTISDVFAGVSSRGLWSFRCLSTASPHKADFWNSFFFTCVVSRVCLCRLKKKNRTEIYHLTVNALCNYETNSLLYFSCTVLNGCHWRLDFFLLFFFFAISHSKINPPKDDLMPLRVIKSSRSMFAVLYFTLFLGSRLSAYSKTCTTRVSYFMVNHSDRMCKQYLFTHSM